MAVTHPGARNAKNGKNGKKGDYYSDHSRTSDDERPPKQRGTRDPSGNDADSDSSGGSDN